MHWSFSRATLAEILCTANFVSTIISDQLFDVLQSPAVIFAAIADALGQLNRLGTRRVNCWKNL